MTQQYFVLCNLLSGSVLEVSDSPLAADGYPQTVKVFDGPVPDPLTHVWSRASMEYIKKIQRTYTHIQFRKLFTPYEELSMDMFNDTYQDIAELSFIQKAMIRTGLKKYKEADVIDLDDSGVSTFLDLYIAVGVITPDRKAEILSGTNKQ